MGQNAEKKRGAVAIFVPHAGCKCACVFCNQRTISGQLLQPTVAEIEEAVRTACKNPRLDLAKTELAFFGGSFTAIDRELMLEYLKKGRELVKRHGLFGIRISTRPDAISEEIVCILKEYGVTTVELGAQSFDDKVLKASARGHSGAAISRAAQLLHSAEIPLVLQLMCGLPCDSGRESIESAKQAISLSPVGVRIYPCLVLENTELAAMYRRGEYRPQTLSAAVELCVKLAALFRSSGIPIIKLGLHASADFESGALLSGPYHPAFRELVEGGLFLEDLFSALPEDCAGKTLSLTINPRFRSTAVGEKRGNIAKIVKKTAVKEVIFTENPAVKKGEFELELY